MSNIDAAEMAETILVVDDAPELLRDIAGVLQEFGYQVLTAPDGTDALQVLQTEHVDLILADIAMPHLNGYQLYEQVRSNPRWMHIPFIFLTGRLMSSDVQYGKALGVDDYLIKPMTIEDLAAVVHGKLRRARQLESTRVSSRGLDQSVLDLGRLHIDMAQHRVWLDDQPIDLSAREFTLLACLARREGQAVLAHELIQVTHELNTDDKEAGSLVRPLIRSLRRKLGYATGEMGCIENVRSVGYRLIMPR
jgi:DNA-binding response OmpR family regulator